MKKIALMLLSVIALISCSDDDNVDDLPFVGDEETFDLNEVGDSGVSGTATFTENEDGSTTVVLELTGTSDGDMHPAHIHMNSAAEGGDIVIDLDAVDGATGMSTTEISETNGGTAIMFEDLVAYDGYINVHKSAEDLTTLMAQGDIGENVLTGESVSYDLSEMDVAGVSGTATFEERTNGETLVTLSLEGTTEGEHPAHIHMGAAEDGPGDIAISLNSVDGATGMSMTNISETDAEDAVTYEDLVAYDGYINVHKSAEDLETLLAQGNIGANVEE